MKSASLDRSVLPQPNEYSLIDEFLGLVPERALEEVITAAIDKVNTPLFTSRRKAHASQNAFFYIVEMLEGFLKDYGFVEDPSSMQQPRLIRYGQNRDPIRIRTYQGKMVDSSVIPNARKGPETRIGVDQNQEHFASPPLLPKSYFFQGTPRELNLTIVFDFSRTHLIVWLVVCSEWKHGRLISCMEKRRLCAKSLVKSAEPTLKVRKVNPDIESSLFDEDEGFSDFRPKSSG